jgi:NDP-sugar pyrophosphorylase family protein
MILHQVEALAAAGVTDIVLAVNYRPEIMIKVLQKVVAQFSNFGVFILTKILRVVRRTIQR